MFSNSWANWTTPTHTFFRERLNVCRNLTYLCSSPAVQCWYEQLFSVHILDIISVWSDWLHATHYKTFNCHLYVYGLIGFAAPDSRLVDVSSHANVCRQQTLFTAPFSASAASLCSGLHPVPLREMLPFECSLAVSSRTSSCFSLTNYSEECSEAARWAGFSWTARTKARCSAGASLARRFPPLRAWLIPHLKIKCSPSRLLFLRAYAGALSVL